LKRTWIVIGIILTVLILDQALKIYVKTSIPYLGGFEILGQDWARLLVSFSLIIAGAIGNIIDSAFYGLIFSESSFHGGIATMFPEEGGYAGFLHGRVVDMFYFPMIDTTYPDWFPARPDGKPGWLPNIIFDNIPWAQERFRFFKPVFNIADAAISVGVASILLFNRSFFVEKKEEKVIDNGELTIDSLGVARDRDSEV